jgi:hypothetical protein
MFPTVCVAAVGIVSTGVRLAAFAALASQAEAQSAVIDVSRQGEAPTAPYPRNLLPA